MCQKELKKCLKFNNNKMNPNLIGKHHNNNNLILINLVFNKLRNQTNNFRQIGVHHHLINNNLIKDFKEIINLIYRLIQKEYQQNQINKMGGK